MEQMAIRERKERFTGSTPKGNLLCFIEGLSAINDHLEFDKNYKDIYSSELELKTCVRYIFASLF